jgi:hypothetical protein
VNRQSLISSGLVVLIAGVVTAAALLIASGSTSPAPKRVALGIPPITSSSTYADRSTAFHPLTQAQMRQQGQLMSSECGIGTGSRRSSKAPLPRLTLTATHDLRTVHLYLVGQQEVICAADAPAGYSISGVAQQPPAPAGTAIALAGVSAGESDGHHATLEYGRAGARVRRVAFVLSHGERVQASLGGGWFLVWWPSGQSPTTARLTTSSRTKTVELGAQAASPSLSCARNQTCDAESSPGRVTGEVKNVGSGSGSALGPPGNTIISRGSPLPPGPPRTTTSFSGELG